MDWANESPSFSNGAVYVDLDNDGDLDIVTNNLDENATILRNNARELGENNFLSFKFKGPSKNRFGVGALIKVYQENGTVLSRELVNARGYLSSVSNTIHFGLGTDKMVSNVEVIWPDNRRQLLKDVKANQIVLIDYNNASDLESQSLIPERKSYLLNQPSISNIRRYFIMIMTNSFYYHINYLIPDLPWLKQILIMMVWTTCTWVAHITHQGSCYWQQRMESL